MTNFLNPPATRDRYIATAAQTVFQITFTEGGVIKSPIVVRTLAVGADGYILKVVTTDYTLDRDANTITFLSGQAEGTIVDLQRGTKRERNVKHDPSSTITGAVLNRDEEQSFRYKQELEGAINRNLGLTDREHEFDARNKPICNVGSAPEGRLDCVLNFGDILRLFSEGLIATLGEADVLYFDGDGTTTDFTLTAVRGSLAETWQIYKNGVRQYPRVATGDDGVFTIVSASGVDDILSFDTAPENGAVIAAMSYTGTVIATLLNDSITGQHIVDGAITMAHLDGGVGDPGRMIFFDNAGAATLDVPIAADISDFNVAVRTSRLDQMATPTASVSMGGQRLTDLSSPALDGDAARKSYVDTRRLDQWAQPTNPVNMGNQRLDNLGTPTESKDGTTKQYVDNRISVILGAPFTFVSDGDGVWENDTGKPVLVVFHISANVIVEVRRAGGPWVTVAQTSNHEENCTIPLAPNDEVRILPVGQGAFKNVFTLLA